MIFVELAGGVSVVKYVCSEMYESKWDKQTWAE
jgi:hypothetical protein